MGTWYVDEQFRYSHRRSGLDTLFFLLRFFALDPQKIWRSVVRNCSGIGLGLSFRRGLNQHASSASALVWAMETIDWYLFLNAFLNIQLRGPSGEGYSWKLVRSCWTRWAMTYCDHNLCRIDVLADNLVVSPDDMISRVLRLIVFPAE